MPATRVGITVFLFLYVDFGLTSYINNLANFHVNEINYGSR